MDAASNAELMTVRMIFRIVISPLMERAICEAIGVSLSLRPALQITIGDVGYYGPAHHEAASKLIDQRRLAAEYWSSSGPKRSFAGK